MKRRENFLLYSIIFLDIDLRFFPATFLSLALGELDSVIGTKAKESKHLLFSVLICFSNA